MNENDTFFDPELRQEAEKEEVPKNEAAQTPPDSPAPQYGSAPQRTDYTRPAAPCGSYDYIPQQPESYRPSAAPRPPVNPQSAPVNPQSAPVNPQNPPVNPYSAQGAYAPKNFQQQQQPYTAAQNPYTVPNNAYVPPVHAQTSASGAYSAPRQPAQKAPKKKNMGVRIAIIALCCALVGSVLGGVIVGFTMHSIYGSEAGVSAAAPTKENAPAQNNTSPTETVTASPANSSGTLTPSEVYQANVAAIVGIANEGTSYNVFGQISKTANTGTGFIISSDGEILTNYHVVEGAQTLTVTMHDGSTYNAIVIGYEAESDIALLKVEASDLPTVTFGDSDQLRVGDEVAAIGNPLGELTYTMTTGIVSSMDRDVNTDGTPINMMQIDAAINPGNSGGPLFDMNGNVVGITTAKYSGTLTSGATIEGIGFAIPINDVLSILDDLRENGTVPNRAYIGITVSTVAASEAMQTPAGAKVESVTEGSCGAAAGLQSGDIIIAVNETTITSTEDLSKELKHYRAGDSAELTVFRNGSELTLTISFDSKPVTSAWEEEQTVPSETDSFDPWDFFLP